MGAHRKKNLDLPTGIYWVRGRLQIAWQANGRRYRQLCPRKWTVAQAEHQRDKYLHDAEDGRPAPVSNRVTYDTLMEQRRVALENAHKEPREYPALNAAFGGRRAVSITYTELQHYVSDRQKAGAADATIHNELAALRRAFRLGRKAGLVVTVPDFPMPRVQNVRESCFTVDELDRLVTILPTHLRAPVRFAAMTGMRAANVFGLKWQHVDFGAGEVRVPVGMTKSGEPLTFPFPHGGALEALLRKQERAKRGEWVFHRSGHKIKSYHGAWRSAMVALGDAGQGSQYEPRTGETRRVPKRFHDLRHTFAQLSSESGMPEATLLELGGWKTPAMLRRYRIVDKKARQAGAAQLEAHVAAEQKRSKVVDLKRAAGGRR